MSTAYDIQLCRVQQAAQDVRSAIAMRDGGLVTHRVGDKLIAERDRQLRLELRILAAIERRRGDGA